MSPCMQCDELERCERCKLIATLRARLAEVERERDSAIERIATIIEVDGYLRPRDIRTAAQWIVSPPRIEVPRPDDWEIDARVAQRNDEIDRVEKIIGLCLEKHFAEQKKHSAALAAKLDAVLEAGQAMHDELGKLFIGTPGQKLFRAAIADAGKEG